MEHYRTVIGRVAAVELLYLVGMVGFFTGPMPLAYLNAFVGAVLAWFGVRRPVASWRQAFWRCFDAAYVAAVVAAVIAGANVFSALGFCLFPAVVFGTAAAIATTFKEVKA
jgi:hypothetical protein